MLHPATLLHVDDNAAGRSALSRILRAAGFEVWEAATGGEALQLAARQPDLVLLDVVLPDLDGREVCRRLKTDPATAATPVLLISGVALSLAERVQGLEGGADAYLTKPVAPEELVAQAKALLRVHQAEEALRESEQRYRFLFERNLAGILLTQVGGQVLDCNAAFLRMLGYDSRAQVLGQSAFAFYCDPADRDTMLARLRAQRYLGNYEARLRHTSGSPVWVITNISQAGPELVFSTLVDVTERRALEEQLRQAQKLEAVGRFASGVAHDFNNLLTAITCFGQALLDSLSEEDPRRELVTEIDKAAARGGALTRQLLAFSRKQKLLPQVLDLNCLVRNLAPMLRQLLGADSQLTLALEPGLYAIRADPSQLEQVLLNLTVNARDAMPHEGRLTVATHNGVVDEAHAGPCALLEVADTGCGMDAATRAHIFEPFFTTKPAGKGTGLGLAIVDGIVQQSGGHIEVESAVGVGTTFTVYLPALRPGV